MVRAVLLKSPGLAGYLLADTSRQLCVKSESPRWSALRALPRPPRLGALSNRLLLALDAQPRFEELTNTLAMRSNEPLWNASCGTYVMVYDQGVHHESSGHIRCVMFKALQLRSPMDRSATRMGNLSQVNLL